MSQLTPQLIRVDRLKDLEEHFTRQRASASKNMATGKQDPPQAPQRGFRRNLEEFPAQLPALNSYACSLLTGHGL